jgi:hypothetical protein
VNALDIMLEKVVFKDTLKFSQKARLIVECSGCGSRVQKGEVLRLTCQGNEMAYMREEAAEWDSKRTVAVKDGERRNGFKVWSGDMLGTSAVLREKRRERNPWLVSQVFFEDHERSRSGVASETVNHEDGLVEEVLKDELQPWEVSC